MGKINIGSIVNDLGIGGTARQLVTIDKYLNNDVFNHIIISVGSKDNTRARNIGNPNVFFAETAEDVVSIVQKQHIHVMYFHRHGRNEPSYDSIIAKIPATVSVIELNTFSAFDGGTFGKRCDKHIFVSQTNLLKYITQNGLSFDFARHKVVYGLVDSKNFIGNMPTEAESAAYRTKYTLDGKFVVGRIARPVMGKWDDATILFWKKLSKKYANAALLIYGVPEERKKTLREAGRQKNLIMLDPTSSDKELALFYSNIDALVHLSPIGECSCGAIAEAMLFWKPVIVTSTPFPRLTLFRSHTKDNGQVEQIKNMINGFVVKNATAMTKAIFYLIGHKSEAKAMGEINRREVAEKYDASIGIKTLDKIFIEGALEKGMQLDGDLQAYYDRLVFYPNKQDISDWFDEYYRRLNDIYCSECRDSISDRVFLGALTLRRKFATLRGLIRRYLL